MSRGIGFRDVDSVVVEFTRAAEDQGIASVLSLSGKSEGGSAPTKPAVPRRAGTKFAPLGIGIASRTMVVDFSVNYQGNYSRWLANPGKRQISATRDDRKRSRPGW